MNLHEITNIIQASKDINYFNNEFVNSGLSLYPHILNAIESIEDEQHNLIVSAKQMGVTTLLTNYVAWKSIFNPNYNTIYFSATYDQSKYVNNILREIFYRVDDACLAPNLKSQINLRNGSTIILMTSKDTHNGRGITPDLCVKEDCGCWNINDFEDCNLVTYPMLAYPKNGKSITTTTATEKYINNDPKKLHPLYRMYLSNSVNKIKFPPELLQHKVNKEWYNKMNEIMPYDQFKLQFSCDFI